MIKNKKGFSLIELLAVIVILGILLSISIVAVNSIRKKQEVENRRNVIIGVLAGARRYASDYNTVFDEMELNGDAEYSVDVSSLVDGGYTDLDENKYDDIYNGSVFVEICDDNNKIKFIYKDGDKTYNDCGCMQQNSENTSELCGG